jgi:hypothetical protein
MTITKHKDDCKMTFGRKDATCPRCAELLAGAAPRSWSRPQSSYVPPVRRACCSFNTNPGGYCNVCGSGSDFS